jgi:hypothetical protein
MKLFCFLIFSLAPALAHAAACCGGGFAAPSLIAGDDKAMLTATYGYSQVLDDIGSDSLWRQRQDQETSTTYKLEGAHIFSDRWQAGASVPVVTRTRARTSSSGFGDIAGNLGYEYLPDWDYSAWRPKGIGFFQLTVPTGRSINESDSRYQLDARGRGFWAIGLGTLLTKTVSNWDFFTDIDVHRSFARRFSNSQMSGTLTPGYGGDLGLGAGYNLKDFRIGGAITWTYEDPVDLSGPTSSKGAAQRFATATASLSYLMPDDWAATLTYSDQTLFGSPLNTTLARGVLLLLQKRFPR